MATILATLAYTFFAPSLSTIVLSTAGSMAIKWGFEKYIKSNDDYYFIYQIASNYSNPRELTSLLVNQFQPLFPNNYNHRITQNDNYNNNNYNSFLNNINNNNNNNNNGNDNNNSVTSSLSKLSNSIINQLNDVSKSIQNEGKAFLIFTLKAGEIAYKIVSNFAPNSIWLSSNFSTKKITDIPDHLLINEIEKMYRGEEFRQVVLNLNEKIAKSHDDFQTNQLLRSWVDLQSNRDHHHYDHDHHDDDLFDNTTDEFGDLLFGTSREFSDFKVGNEQISLFEDYSSGRLISPRHPNHNNNNNNNNNNFNNINNEFIFDEDDDDDFHITPLL